jgi:hypothetical protein
MNNLNYYYLFYCLLLFFGCHHTASTNSQPKVLEISKSTYKGKPIIGDQNIFSEIFSKPIIKLDSCSQARIGYIQGYWIYDCITPEDDKSVTYSIHENVVFLSKINFSSPSVKIITPNLILSNQTTLAEIITLFPDSYPQMYKDKPQLDKRIFKLAHISDDLPINKRLGSNQLELQFENNLLISLTYFWKPEMTPQQISIMKKRNQQAKE